MLLLQIPVMESEAVEGIQEHPEFRTPIQQVPTQKVTWKLALDLVPT